MEAFVLAVAASCFAGFSAACASWWIMARAEVVRSGSTKGLVEHDGRLAWLLRNGVSSLRPFGDLLVRAPMIRAILEDGVSMASRKGFASSPEALSTVVLASGTALFAVTCLLFRTLLAGALVTLCVVAIVAIWVRTAEEKEAQIMREQAPEVVRSLSACISTGLSLEQSFEQLEKESQGPLKTTFGRMAGILKTGGTADQALFELKSCRSVPELAFVGVALDVQHQTGGSLRQVLDSARDMIEDELELQRSLRVQTAQAKLSARIVTVMPFILVTLFSLTTEGFLEPFFRSASGLALLSLAVLMQVSGVLLVRRMLNVRE